MTGSRGQNPQDDDSQGEPRRWAWFASLFGRPGSKATTDAVPAGMPNRAVDEPRPDDRYAVVEVLNEGVLIVDAEGRLDYCNPAAERWFGFSRDALKGLAPADWGLVDAEGRALDATTLPILDVIATRQPARGIVVGRPQRVGGPVWFEVDIAAVPGVAGTSGPSNPSGGATGAVVSFTDVTGRRRTEAALRNVEDTQRTLMDAMTDGVFVARDQRFVFANEALPAMLGYGRDEFVGLSFERVLVPDALPVWLERFAGRIGEGTEPVRSYETQFLRKDGLAIDVELVANRVRFEGAPAVLGVIRNITERAQWQAEVRLHRTHLEELVAARSTELQQANAALTRAELFSRTIADNMPVRISYWTRELRCAFVNRSSNLRFARSPM